MTFVWGLYADKKTKQNKNKNKKGLSQLLCEEGRLNKQSIFALVHRYKLEWLPKLKHFITSNPSMPLYYSTSEVLLN